MIQVEKGTCSKCGTPDVYIVNKTHELCERCNRQRLDERKALRSGNPQNGQNSGMGGDSGLTGLKQLSKHGRNSPLQRRRKPSGEALLFLALAQSRPHICFVCKQPIRPMTFNSMAHVLAKGLYPKFRLLDRNIVFLCSPFSENRCHYRYDFEPHSELQAEPEWKPLFELREELLTNYRKLENK